MADISDVVRQRADALMLSGESAVGAYPDKAVNVLRNVATQIEEWVRCAPVQRSRSQGSRCCPPDSPRPCRMQHVLVEKRHQQLTQ